MKVDDLGCFLPVMVGLGVESRVKSMRLDGCLIVVIYRALVSWSVPASIIRHAWASLIDNPSRNILHDARESPCKRNLAARIADSGKACLRGLPMDGWRLSPWPEQAMLVFKNVVEEAVVAAPQAGQIHQHDSSIQRWELMFAFIAHANDRGQWAAKFLQGQRPTEEDIRVCEETKVVFCQVWQDWDVNPLPCTNLQASMYPVQEVIMLYKGVLFGEELDRDC